MRVEKYQFRSLDGLYFAPLGMPEPPEPVSEFEETPLASDAMPDDVSSTPAPVAPPPETVTMSKAQYEETLRQAEERGLRAGIEQQKQKHEREEHEQKTLHDQQLHSLLGTVEKRLMALQQQHQELFDPMAADASHLAVAIARKFVDDAVEQESLAPVRQLIEECLPKLVGKPRITVEVHDSLLVPLQSVLDDVCARSGFVGELTIQSCADFTSTLDCRVRWHNGSLEKRADAVWKEIEERISRFDVRAFTPDSASNDALSATGDDNPPDQREENVQNDGASAVVSDTVDNDDGTVPGAQTDALPEGDADGG